ncbi:hypothetical protein CASFOL_005444 [Castilleja foliolosa]|uniref:Cytochrome P450 n=1 Tax=Castilleja foliolosa TaxID=1961234 RepID=A0ABD3E3H9_9LAMI
MWELIIAPLFTILAIWTWQIFNWVWLKPKKIERLFRQQGMKGHSYKLLFGEMKEAKLMYDEVYSKPIGIDDDILPRLMPNMLDTIANYGDYSFTWLGPRPRVYIMDHNLFKEMMSNYRKYHKSFDVINPIAKMLISTGLASMEGDEWAKSRSKLNPAFHMNKLKPTLPAVQVCCENILSEWKEMTKSGGNYVIDVIHHLEIYTSSVLAQVMFGSTYTDKIKQVFFQLLELESLGKLATDVFTLPGQKYYPTKKNRKAHEIDKFIRDSFKSMIHERLENRKAGADFDKRQDLLDLFMDELYDEKTSNGKSHSKLVEDVIGQLKIFFFAGFGSTSNTICWTMVMLSVHKEWQDRARQEVMQVIGDDNEITTNHLGQLKVITMIVNEVLRLYPPTMEISRLIVEETKIGKYTIPKGTLVTCPILLLYRSTEVWGHDAKNFNPERFAEGVARATRNNGSAPYLPFGWGPRICIAQNLAMLELKVFLALMLRKFSFDLAPSYRHAPHVDFTIHPQYGAPFVLTQL